MGGAVRVGVLGLRRGAALARLAREAGMQLVAVCERDDERREYKERKRNREKQRAVEASRAETAETDGSEHAGS